MRDSHFSKYTEVTERRVGMDHCSTAMDSQTIRSFPLQPERIQLFIDDPNKCDGTDVCSVPLGCPSH